MNFGAKNLPFIFIDFGAKIQIFQKLALQNGEMLVLARKFKLNF